MLLKLMGICFLHHDYYWVEVDQAADGGDGAGADFPEAFEVASGLALRAADCSRALSDGSSGAASPEPGPSIRTAPSAMRRAVKLSLGHSTD
jgi:hypothetical protein